MGSMHLRDAMLDDSGNAYAVGHISFPDSVGGEFRAVSAPLVKLRFDAQGGLSLSPSNAQRNPKNHYLSDDEIPLRVSLPLAVANFLSEILRQIRERTPTSFSIDAQGGLATGRAESTLRQGLTRWEGTVTVLADDVVRVELSAALRSDPKPEWQKTQTDFWGVGDDEPPRLTASFEIDVVTRVVRVGGYSTLLPQLPRSRRETVVPSTLRSMNLETTPIAFHDQLYGITDDGQLVSFYEAFGKFRYLSIDAPGPDVRLANGFVEMSNRFPRIRFTGIDLDVVSKAMWRKLRFEVELTDGEAGEVQYSAGAPDYHPEIRTVTRASLEFELTDSGLVFNYSVKPEGAALLSGKITIPWEVLIVRSPLFGNHRHTLLKK